MLRETVNFPQAKRPYILVPIPEFKKQIVIACAIKGQAKVLWTKVQSDIYTKQIIQIDKVKYMCRFEHNKIKEIHLLEETK